jgi:hypothetical protein
MAVEAERIALVHFSQKHVQRRVIQLCDVGFLVVAEMVKRHGADTLAVAAQLTLAAKPIDGQSLALNPGFVPADIPSVLVRAFPSDAVQVCAMTCDTPGLVLRLATLKEASHPITKPFLVALLTYPQDLVRKRIGINRCLQMSTMLFAFA